MRGQAPRIDLKTPGLSFLVNPSNGDRPLECDSISTSHFLGKHLLQAAITHQSLVSPSQSEMLRLVDHQGVAASAVRTASQN
jgi:hypothetical protein